MFQKYASNSSLSLSFKAIYFAPIDLLMSDAYICPMTATPVIHGVWKGHRAQPAAKGRVFGNREIHSLAVIKYIGWQPSHYGYWMRDNRGYPPDPSPLGGRGEH